MRIGEILVQRGAVTAEQVEEALAHRDGSRLGSTLAKLGYVEIDEVSRALAQQKSIPSLRLEYFKNADPEAIEALDPTMAAHYFAAGVGFKSDNGVRKLVVAFRDPDHADAVEALSETTGYEIIPCVVAEALLYKAIERFYDVQPTLQLAQIEPVGQASAGTLADPRAAMISPLGPQPDPEHEVEVQYGICIEHPERATAFVCAKCQAEWCFDCSAHTWMGKGFVDLCRRCNQPLVNAKRKKSQRAQSGPRAAPADGRSLRQRLPELVRFPFTNSGLVLLIGLVAIATALGLVELFFAKLMGGGWAARLIRIFVKAFELTIFFGILTATAQGKNKIEISDIIRLDESVYAPLKRFIAAHVPLIIGVFWWGFSLVDQSVIDLLLGGDMRVGAILEQLTLPTLAVLLGFFLLPLLITVAAVTDSALTVLYPKRWLQALRVLGKRYLPAAGLFYLIYIFEMLLEIFVLRKLASAIDMVIVSLPIITFIGYIPYAIRMRVLGGMLAPCHEELQDAISE